MADRRIYVKQILVLNGMGLKPFEDALISLHRNRCIKIFFIDEGSIPLKTKHMNYKIRCNLIQ